MAQLAQLACPPGKFRMLKTTIFDWWCLVWTYLRFPGVTTYRQLLLEKALDPGLMTGTVDCVYDGCCNDCSSGKCKEIAMNFSFKQKWLTDSRFVKMSRRSFVDEMPWLVYSTRSIGHAHGVWDSRKVWRRSWRYHHFRIHLIIRTWADEPQAPNYDATHMLYLLCSAGRSTHKMCPRLEEATDGRCGNFETTMTHSISACRL